MVCWAVIDCRDDTRVELDIATQVEPVRNVVHVFEDCRLCGVAFRPLPLGLQLLGEGIRVLQALNVATGTGIAASVIAHLLPAEVNVEVLTRVARTLRPGAMLVYVDQVTGHVHRSRLASLLIQFMALTVATVGGSCYPFATVKTWLEQVGMGHVQQHRLLIPGATLITARKL